MHTAFPARRLRSALFEAFITRQQFSAVSGISISHLSRILHGHRKPGPLTIFRLQRGLAVLGVDLHELTTLDPLGIQKQVALQLELPFDRIDQTAVETPKKHSIFPSGVTSEARQMADAEPGSMFQARESRPTRVCKGCGERAPAIRAANRDFAWTCSHCSYAGHDEGI